MTLNIDIWLDKIKLNSSPKSPKNQPTALDKEPSQTNSESYDKSVFVFFCNYKTHYYFEKIWD